MEHNQKKKQRKTYKRCKKNNTKIKKRRQNRAMEIKSFLCVIKVTELRIAYIVIGVELIRADLNRVESS